MIVTAEPKMQIVKDFDFKFSSGDLMSVTVNEELGDYVKETETGWEVFMAPKPSLNYPNETLAAELIRVSGRHLLFVAQRERKVMERTIEEKTEWVRTMKEVAGIH